MGQNFWTALPTDIAAVVITVVICGTVLLYQRMIRPPR